MGSTIAGMPWQWMNLESPLGRIRLLHARGVLYAVELSPVGGLPETSQSEDTVWAAAFADYFADGQYRFSLPFSLGGTDFQQRVWAALQEIPPGETRTYGELAKSLNSSPRAVGNACRANPCAIVVPCHRVVSAVGLGGYAGATHAAGLAPKRWLLRHEGWPGV